MLVSHKSVLALDVGGKRVGVAIASLEARLPRPLTTLERNDAFLTKLTAIIEAEDIGMIIVGLPRDLNGQYTPQTRSTEAFIKQLKQYFKGPIHPQDEAVTSKQAEAELQSRGGDYARGDIDALAATYILEDFLREYRESPA
ncbi:MAG: Holliday junction resolvase RuvX [Candidatus Saccharimonadales bacterium]